jgi:SOS-response transcriptional repressor LexA
MTFKRVEEITEKQGEVLNFLIDHVSKYGYQPSIGEMAKEFGITHVAMADRIRQLASKGVLDLPGPRQERCFLLRHYRFSPVLVEDLDCPAAAELDEHEANVWATMVDVLAEIGYQPTKDELGRLLGRCRKTVAELYDRLTAKGYLGAPPKTMARAYRIYQVRFVPKFDPAKRAFWFEP